MSENKTKGAGADLAMMALEDIPSPKADAKEIVALVKQSGRITGYQLSDGRTLNKEEGVKLAKCHAHEKRGVCQEAMPGKRKSAGEQGRR